MFEPCYWQVTCFSLFVVRERDCRFSWLVVICQQNLAKGFAHVAEGQNFVIYANSNVCEAFTRLDQGNDLDLISSTSF